MNRAGRASFFAAAGPSQSGLYGTVRAAVSTFDTLNHIGPYEQFERALCRSALFIEPGGVLLFDMNTPYKHRAVLANHTYSLEAEDVTCLWKTNGMKQPAAHISRWI